MGVGVPGAGVHDGCIKVVLGGGRTPGRPYWGVGRSEQRVRIIVQRRSCLRPSLCQAGGSGSSSNAGSPLGPVKVNAPQRIRRGQLCLWGFPGVQVRGVLHVVWLAVFQNEGGCVRGSVRFHRIHSFDALFGEGLFAELPCVCMTGAPLYEAAEDFALVLECREVLGGVEYPCRF